VAITAVAGGAHALSGLSRAARRARRASRRATKQIDHAARILNSREDALRQSARHYIDAQTAERLRGVSIRVILEQTDKPVKVAPLEKAGYTTLAELVGKSRAELRAVRGIGSHSARAIEAAVRDFLATARTMEPQLPGPELAEPRAVDLARACVVYLEAWRALGDAPARMREALSETDIRAAIAEAQFRRWLLGLIGGRNREAATRLLQATEHVEALVEHEAFVCARDAVAGMGSRRLDTEAVRASFVANYADACAVLERIFGELKPDAVPATAAAPAMSAIAARVESQALDTTGLKVILRGYQAFGARYILSQERCLLGDEMGLGKTIQALAATMHLTNTSTDTLRSLVVAPASILGNWMHEIAVRTPLPCHLVYGDEFDAARQAWVDTGGIGVTSYTTLRRKRDAFDQPLALLIADEAHYIKNPEAGRTQAVRAVARHANRVCFMTGTPLENHPEEFVHLLDTLSPRRARSLGEFLDRPGAHLGGARRFHAEVADVYLRRNQEDVLKELPERIDKEEWIDLEPSGRDAYAREVAAGNFMGMRRAVTGEAKLERMEDLIEEYRESGIKVLLFSYFLEVLAEVERRFEACGRIAGDVPPQRRFELAQQFQEAEGHHLLIAQIQAGGTGLNLHAAGAVILMEPQLKPTTEAQAIARAHRMGQTRRVVVHRLLARDCVDERLVELLAEKQDLFERFARDSLVKEASEQATASAAIVAAERRRMEGAT